MALTTYTLEGNVADLAGDLINPRSAHATLETNLPKGTALIDKAGKVLHVGAKHVPIAADGKILVPDLIATNSADTNTPDGFQYRFNLTWPDVTSRSSRLGSFTTGWFSLTADTNLADVVGEEFIAPAVATVLYEETVAAKEAAEAAAELAVAPTAEQLAAVDANAASAFRQQQDARLTDTFGAKGGNVTRFIRRAQAGEALTITTLGDSILHGQTVTNPATDGTSILLAADLSARFSTTVTQNNRAVGGRTLLTAHTFGDVETALNDKADLYLISYGKNDSQVYFGTQAGEYGPGYPRAQSLAALERLVRRIRDRVPKADIILMGSNPYIDSLNGVTNTALKAYNDGMQRLAAQYGCEWVDNFNSFVAKGDRTPYMHADGVHPNTAGHRLMTDTLLEHFPADYAGVPIAPGRPGSQATLMPGHVDTTVGTGGYLANSNGIATTNLTWTKGGTGWAGTAPHTTSTAGDYLEATFNGTEFHANISCRDADSPIFDITVDGTLVKTDANPLLAGGRIDYYVPIALGLAPGPHTVRMTLKSGTLKVNQVAALVGPGSDLTGTVVSLDLSGTVATKPVPADGTTAYAIYDVAVPLPAGWVAMDVDITATLMLRVSGETLTWREFQVVIRRTTTAPQWAILSSWKDALPPVVAGTVARRTIVTTAADIKRTAQQLYRVEIIATGTDKTNQHLDSWKITATCRRVA